MNILAKPSATERMAVPPIAPVTTTSNSSVERAAAIMLALMVASQIINHFDRAILAVASAEIMRELHLSPEQYGLLASAFYSVYVTGGLLVGIFLAHRVRARPMATWLIAFWTVAQIPVLIFPSFAALLVSRMVLGAAESPSFGAATAVAHEWYPSHRRNVPTSFILFGSLSGGVIAPPILVAVMASFGWRGGFVACAILSGVLFAALVLLGRDPPEGHLRPSTSAAARPAVARGAGPRWLDWRIVTITLVGFATYWVISFLFTWLFPLLNLGWGYDTEFTGWGVSAVYFLTVIPLLAVSAISQKKLQRGVTFSRSVVIPTAASLFTTAAFLCLTAFLPAGWPRLVSLALSFAMIPSVLAAIPVMVSRVVSEAERNRLLMVVAALQSSAGIIAPYATGLLIHRSGDNGYHLALLSCCAAAVIGGLLAMSLAKDSKWNERA